KITFIILTSLVAITVRVPLLGFILLYRHTKLVKSGHVSNVNDGNPENTLVISADSGWLSTLSASNNFLPSASGGGGTCAMCKCVVEEGGGDVLPTEVGHLSRAEQKENVRLSCQVKVKQDMQIRMPEEIFGSKKWECEVVSNYNVSTFIKEFVVR